MGNSFSSLSPKPLVAFRCLSCQTTFDAEPDRVVDEPSRAHPYRYFSSCQKCSDECEQAPWQVGVFCANANATGPRTAEGKAKVSKNLEGHNTELTRFNALKHGASAQTAVFFPAKPDKYPHCQSCDVDRDYCRQQPACVRRTDLTMRYLAAVKSGDPRYLSELMATNQAMLQALFADMMQAVISDGARIEQAVYDFDKEGGFHLGQYLDEYTGEKVTMTEVKAHPLLKPLFELLSKNNLSMSDMGMTPKVQTDQGIELGRLQNEEDDRESEGDYKKQVSDNMAALRGMFERSQDKVKNDPVLIEHGQEEGQVEKDISPHGR